MGSLTTAAKNAALDALTISHAAIHDGSDVQIGSRQAITIDAASSGGRPASTQPEFAVGAGVTVTRISFWNQGSGGQEQGSDDENEVFSNAGTYILTSATFTIADS